MFHRRAVLPIVILILLLSACTPKNNNQADVSFADPTAFPRIPPEACPVTQPPASLFTPPKPYPQRPSANDFWYGSTALWTALPKDGVWSELPHNPEGYGQKTIWSREGYSWTEEPEPELRVTGKRLDVAAPPLTVHDATNAYTQEIGSVMLIEIDLPTLGCWEITGHYKNNELSFVIWVTP